MYRRTIVLGPIAALATVVVGCDDDRLARIAEQSTREQARQNERVSQAHASLVDGSKQLVAADAATRRDLVQLQDKLRQDQAGIGQQRDALEAERRTLASERGQDSLCSSSLLSLGILLACLAPLILAGLALANLNLRTTQQEMNEVLVQELTGPLGYEPVESHVRVTASEADSLNLPPPTQRF